MQNTNELILEVLKDGTPASVYEDLGRIYSSMIDEGISAPRELRGPYLVHKLQRMGPREPLYIELLAMINMFINDNIKELEGDNWIACKCLSEIFVLVSNAGPESPLYELRDRYEDLETSHLAWNLRFLLDEFEEFKSRYEPLTKAARDQ